MPPIVKYSAQHILISLFVAPIMLGLFAWFGGEFIGTRDVKVLMPTITKQLDEIQVSLKVQNHKQDELLKNVWQNKEDIAVIKATLRGD